MMPQGKMEEFVLSICSPGADYPQALSFFKLLQQATGDVSGSTQNESKMIDIMYKIMNGSYHLWYVRLLEAIKSHYFRIYFS